MAAVAQLVRVPDCGSEGRRFESDPPPKIEKGQFTKVDCPFFYISTFFILRSLLFEFIDHDIQQGRGGTGLQQQFHRHLDEYHRYNG